MESCEGLPAVLKGGEQDEVLTFQMEWNNSLSTCVLNGPLASPRPAYFKLVIDMDATIAITGNSSLRADVDSEGTIVVNDGAILNIYGIVNNGVMMVQQGGTLINEGMISPRLGNIDGNLVLLGNASKIKIINDGELVNQEAGYIENFGAIVNSGTLRNDGEIVSFYDGSISNVDGGAILNHPNRKISIASNGTVTNSGIETLFSNFGHFSNEGAVNNSDGATLENIGYGSLINGGVIYNDRNATISNTSVSDLANDWKIYNGCTGIIDGIISGQPIESLCER